MTARRDLAMWSALAGIAAFAGLMAMALVRFPGGNRYDPAAPGFDFFDNYWCDLFDVRTRAGVPNGGRPFAIAASVTLFLSLVPLWWALPARLLTSPWLIRIARISGAIGMIGATLTATPWHDLGIKTAVPFGGLAYFAAIAGLFRQGRGRMASVGLVSLVLAVADFALWAAHVGERAIPAVQKLALASFVAWVGLLAWTAREGSR